MKKLLLILFLVVDIVLIVAAGGFLFFYVQHKPLPYIGRVDLNTLKTMSTSSPMPVAMSTPSSLSTPSDTPAIPPTPTPSPTPAMTPSSANPLPSGYRNIRFLYKNTKAREVFIRADFTGWKGNPMKKDAAGAWVYDAQLPPGEYAYCYAVDNRIIPDPASKRFKKIGQNKVSAIVVTPPK